MRAIAVGTLALLLMLGNVAPLFADDVSVKLHMLRGEAQSLER
jgi:hypothetical protein